MIQAIAIAVAIFAVSMAVAFAARTAMPGLVGAHPWIEQFALKTTLAGLSILAGAKGFQKPVSKVAWSRVILPGLGLGALGTLLVLAGGSTGLNSVFGSYGFLGIVFWIWFYSSLTEEIFTRGWFQTYVEQRGGNGVLASALLFGAMHISLIRKIDPWAVTVIVILACALGYLAGLLRKRYDSLLPAFVIHLCFNVGGMLGGILYTLGYRIATGHLPQMKM